MTRKKTKVCILVPTHWEARMGGAQYQAKILIEHLLDKNCEIYYLARRVNQEFKPHDYQILKIPSLQKISRYGFFFDAFGLFYLLRKIRPNVIYQRVACAYTGIAAYYAKCADCRMVWHVASDKDFRFFDKSTVKDYLPHTFIERKFLEYGIRNASAVVVQNEYQAKGLELYYCRKPTALIRNFHPSPQEIIEKKNPIKILWVANFKPFKQPQLFIRLAKNLGDLENVEFLMVGGPADDKEWQALLVKEIATINNLNYLGPLQQVKVNELFASCHIFVNTSLYEGFANTFVQAWMREVPVVSLAVNPNGVFDTKKVGFLSGTFEGMCEDVRVLSKNPTLISKMGKQAKRYALEMHSEKNVEELISILMI
jgi:glycosyltransferase involved in cell wall biosynthesis